MKAAQKEIRSTVTVNTIDLGSKKREEDSDVMALGPRMRGEDLPGNPRKCCGGRK
jgi:inositol 1,4,5-triphosphate receptor type 2